MADPRHMGPNPKGPVREMTREWKALVLARIAELGRDIPWFAEQIGLSRSAGYKLFAENQDGSMVQIGSAEVPAICDLLGVPPPMVANPAVSDTKDGRVMELIQKVPDDVKDGVIAMLAAVLRNRQ